MMCKPIYRVVFYYKYTLYPVYVRNTRGLPKNFRSLETALKEAKKYEAEYCKYEIIKL
ncbi:MAG: hypothetical protein ABSA17_09235 [Rhabdochlamydiaceae bacterium]